MVVLLNILKRLKLNYSDEITIRFIIHGAFVIERAVRSDPLPNKKTREIINSHADIYNTISEELDALNNIFNITISKAEIATITQIFLEYMIKRIFFYIQKKWTVTHTVLLSTFYLYPLSQLFL